MKIVIILFIAMLNHFSFAADTLKGRHPFYGSQEKSLARDLLILTFHGAPGRVSLAEQGYLQILKLAIADGPSTMTTNEYQDKLFALGAEIEANISPNVFSVVVKAPPENFAEALKLMRTTIEHLRTGEADFKSFKERAIATAKASFEEMRTATIYFATRNYAKDSEQIRTGDSSPKAIEKLTFSGFQNSVFDILKFRQTHYTFIGPSPIKKVKEQIQKELSEWVKEKYVAKKVARMALPPEIKTEVFLINKAGATDHQVFFLFPQAFSRDDISWQEGNLAMDWLGGGLHSDLGRILRGERGLTYGVAANMSSNILPFWWVWSFAGSQHVKELLKGIPEVIQKFKERKMTGEQIADAKMRIKNGFLSNSETSKDRLLIRNWYIANGYSTAIYEQYLNRLASVSLEQVEKFKSRLQSNSYQLYLMGDKSVLMPILKELGYQEAQIHVSEFTSLE